MKPVGSKVALAVVVLVLAAACGKHEKPTFTFMPEMAYSPAIKAQEDGSMRTPPAGTVAQNQERYAPGDNIEAAASLKNPLPRSLAVLKRGQDQFNVYCKVCHGPYGEGDGTVVPKFPRPPSLQSDKIKGYPDGKIFHVMTRGQNLMPSYASQVEPKDRWAIVHYIRVLHRAKNPTAADLEALKNW